MKQKHLLFILFISLISHLAQAQHKVIARVLDAETNVPISGASISIERTGFGTNSNSAGYFEMDLDTTDLLIIQKEGYESGKILVPNLSGFKILLKKNEIALLVEVDSKYEKGAALDDYKIGVWEYYDTPGKLSLKIDYDEGSLLYLEKDTTAYVILDGGEWANSTLDQQPRYMGSMHEFYKILTDNIKYPKKALKNSLKGTFSLQFIIDTIGQATNLKLINEIGEECGQKVIAAFEMIPNIWLVAKKGDRKYRSKFSLPFEFRIEKVEKRDSKNKKRKKKKRRRKSKDVQIARELEGIVVTETGVYKVSEAPTSKPVSSRNRRSRN
jgi:hypothetical protein